MCTKPTRFNFGANLNFRLPAIRFGQFGVGGSFYRGVFTLNRGFFERPAVTVARDLIGVVVVKGDRQFRIVETEAYGGSDDPASHAFHGPTKRCAPMFEPGGYIYVYLSYGVHKCLNFVTGAQGEGSAVLIRSFAEVPNTEGLFAEPLIVGPGRVGKCLEADLSWSGIDLFSEESPLRMQHGRESNVVASKRIGISKGVEFEWRFYDSKFSRLAVKESR